MNELRTTLDTGKETYMALKCKQNDDRTLVLTLLSNGVVWIPEVGSILELRGKRADSTVTIQTTTGITITNNVVTIALSKEFTKIQGTVELELNIRKLTEITTFTFILVIEPSVIQDGAIVSENTSSLLEELKDISDWGNMHLNNAIRGVVNLTKKHGQYSVGLASGTRIVLPTVEKGEYVDINYMFYANGDLFLVFDDDIKWSSHPIIQLGKSYRFSFRYVDGVWYCEWVELDVHTKDYVYKYDAHGSIGGGWEYHVSNPSCTITNDNGVLSLKALSSAYDTENATAITKSKIDMTKYVKLYLDYDCQQSASSRPNIRVGTLTQTRYSYNLYTTTRRILVIDIGSITGLYNVLFIASGDSTLNIYNAWFEEDGRKITKTDVGLSNVDNTSDLLKPISTATQTALNGKVDDNQVLTNVPLNAKFTDTVYVHPIGTNPHGTTKSDVGLGNVDNTTDLNKPISTATQTALNDKISTNQKGVTNGVAQLNSNGVVPSSQLPSYVDDVLEYSSNSLFPSIGESGKIYINTTTNITYRWTGSGYAEISPSIALGETSSTAYAGDKGKATTDKVNGHTGNTSNPHSVTKAQVGLSNVPNVATNSQTPTYTVASTNTALASGEVLSTAFGKIAKAISSLISHLADKVSHITSTERTNWDNKATQSNIDASIDKIQIGGRNLLTNTAMAKDSAGWTLTHTGITRDTTFLNNGINTFKYNISGLTNDSWYSARQSTPIGGTAGQQYTASCEVYVPLVNGIDGDIALEIIYYNSAGTRIGSATTYVNQSITNSWQKLTITGVAPTGTTEARTWVWCQRNGHFWMSHPKLEKGNKATDWTPAIEDVDSAIEDIDNAIDNIEIGGRNLLLKSDVPIANADYNLKRYRYGGQVALHDEVYTVTIKFELGADRTALYLYTGEGYVNVVPFYNSDRNSEGIASKTFIMKYAAGRFPEDGFAYIDFYQHPNSGTTTSSIEWVKLEKGNKATDWTPAPEDVDSAIALKADKTTSGTTATRPIPTHIGQTHFDTTLGRPIWCKTVETPVWVDSTGTVV